MALPVILGSVFRIKLCRYKNWAKTSFTKYIPNFNDAERCIVHGDSLKRQKIRGVSS
jgi:hypothetical protein